MNTKQILCIIFVNLITVLSPASVTTSFPILSLIVGELVSGEITVNTLTQSGEEAHHYEMNPRTLMQLQKHRLLIVNGLGFEHWLSAIEQNKLIKGKIVIASEGITPLKSSSGEIDPHAWHDPANLGIYIDNIHKALVIVYPQQKPFIDSRAKTLKEKLTSWKQQKDQQMATLPKPFYVITAHSAFNYLAKAFDFRTLALLGDHEGETLSPRQLTAKITELKKQPRRAFFGDRSKQDQTLREWAGRTASPWGGILWGDSLEKSHVNISLIDYMEHNLSTLIRAMQNSVK